MDFHLKFSFLLEIEHFKTKADRDGPHRAVEPARPAMPAFIGIFYAGDLPNPVKVNDIQRTVKVAFAATDTLFKVYHRWHGSPLPFENRSPI
jgi:hypothetical protein